MTWKKSRLKSSQESPEKGIHATGVKNPNNNNIDTHFFYILKPPESLNNAHFP